MKFIKPKSEKPLKANKKHLTQGQIESIDNMKSSLNKIYKTIEDITLDGVLTPSRSKPRPDKLCSYILKTEFRDVILDVNLEQHKSLKQFLWLDVIVCGKFDININKFKVNKIIDTIPCD